MIRRTINSYEIRINKLTNTITKGSNAAIVRKLQRKIKQFNY